MTRCACLVFALALAVPALANIPFPDLCVLENAAGSDGAVVFVLPNGAGSAFTEARLGGAQVDGTLTLTVVNSLGDPIASYPAEDIWLQSTGGGLVACSMINPEGPTDVNGQTTFVQSPNAGGSSRGEDAQAVIAGDPVPTTAMIHVVSSDMSGDLLVDLTDITLFSQALATYNADADFDDSGIIDLTDISIFTSGLNVVCP